MKILDFIRRAFRYWYFDKVNKLKVISKGLELENTFKKRVKEYAEYVGCEMWQAFILVEDNDRRAMEIERVKYCPECGSELRVETEEFEYQSKSWVECTNEECKFRTDLSDKYASLEEGFGFDVVHSMAWDRKKDYPTATKNEVEWQKFIWYEVKRAQERLSREAKERG